MNPSPARPQPENAEEEPRLKYQRLDGDVPSVLKAHAASRLCVSDKMLALGTQNGGVHLLDYAGNEVRSASVCGVRNRVCKGIRQQGGGEGQGYQRS